MGPLGNGPGRCLHGGPVYPDQPKSIREANEATAVKALAVLETPLITPMGSTFQTKAESLDIP
jgi:hypothetical protein